MSTPQNMTIAEWAEQNRTLIAEGFSMDFPQFQRQMMDRLTKPKRIIAVPNAAGVAPVRYFIVDDVG